MEKTTCPDPVRPGVGAGPAAGEPATKKSDGGVGEGTAPVCGWIGRTCIGRWLPEEYGEELHKVLRLTGPLLLSRLLSFLLKFTTSIFCGHIGNSKLAGYALASTTINLTTAAIGFGLIVACDTLISQTFGSKNMKRVGVILQRSMLILLIYCLISWALLLNSYNILLLLQQQDQVARIANHYVMIFLPAVPAMFLYHLQVAYLQNQGITLPPMFTAAATNVFNLVANYVLIFSFQLGVTGSAIANSLSEIVACLLLFSYIRWRNLHGQTWGGWSTECLQEWGSHMKLAIPSALIVCFEWWIWEIGGILAGILGELDLAAQHIIMEIGAITYMVPLGVHAAACVCIGNALGAGNTAKAKVICKVVLAVSGILAVGQGIVLASCKSFMGYIFTSDATIVATVSEALTIYTFVQFFDSLLCVSTGVFIGAGMQKLVALSNLVSYYVFALPLGIALMFAAKLRILGLWLGIFISVIVQTGLFLVLIYKLDWKEVTRKAQQRSGKKAAATLKVPVSVNEALVADINTTKSPANAEGVEAPTADGYRLVDTQDLKADRSEVDNKAASSGTAGEAERSKAKSSEPPALLSPTQLALRRGLALLVSVLIFASGIAIRIAFPIPEPTVLSGANGTQIQDYNSTSSPLTLVDFTLSP